MPITRLASTQYHSMPLGPRPRLDSPSEMHLEGELRVGEFPRIPQLEPLVGLLDLEAVHDLLVEDAEIVAQAIADRRNIQVDIESRKQAARRPRPPLPSPASTS